MSDQTEIQRLRAALMEIKQLLNKNRENDGAFQSWNHMQAWKVAAQALSTTIEPTNVAKVERFECPCCGCEINAKERVGTDEWRHKYFGAEWPKAEGDGNE